ncbi:hypothetical protein SH1V18_03470 [Vallitalea longa]|uniref:Uncharacterized protein n=1 Tax=Vallitalea longa TaxID=2936439 RepID=A0A9W5Y7H8_9FIRM|nr:hypothetical protein [Vallitalea longa]GKX27867.1 hypothetical protein SH1V18_03470 [Vallitalea longa]
MINIKKLSVALKNKDTVRWIIKDGYSYILTEHFGLKTKKEIKGSALTALIKIIGGIPQEGQGLENHYGLRSQLNKDKIDSTISLFNISNRYKSVEFTHLIQQLDQNLYSIFKADTYIYADKTYVDLINLNKKDIEFVGRDKISPIYATKEEEKILIVPVRLREELQYLTA